MQVLPARDREEPVCMGRSAGRRRAREGTRIRPHRR